MAVPVTYVGGPRNGKKNLLQGYDTAPKKIPVKERECKAANMPHGSYLRNAAEQGDKPAVYIWSVS